MQTLTFRTVRRVTSALLLAALALPLQAAEVGEEAPELDVTEWIQGELKLTENPGKKIRLIQFFSTVNAASVTAMDDMEKWKTELSAKVDFIAVSNQGKTTIQTFLENHAVTYSVAVDGYDNSTAEFAEKKSLPWYVIVTGEGVLAWEGGTADEPRDTLDEMIAGTFDVEHYAKLSAARKELVNLGGGTTMDDIEAALDKVLELAPADAQVFSQRIGLLGARRDAERYLAWAAKFAGWAKDDATALNLLAWDLVTNSSLEWRDPELAVKTAKQAVDSAKEDEKGAILDTYARALYQVGLVDDAIKQQKAAIAITDDEDQKKDLQKTLKYYEAAKKAQKSAK